MAARCPDRHCTTLALLFGETRRSLLFSTLAWLLPCLLPSSPLCTSHVLAFFLSHFLCGQGCRPRPDVSILFTFHAMPAPKCFRWSLLSSWTVLLLENQPVVTSRGALGCVLVRLLTILEYSVLLLAVSSVRPRQSHRFPRSFRNAFAQNQRSRRLPTAVCASRPPHEVLLQNDPAPTKFLRLSVG